MEKEIYKAFEETTTKNVKAVVELSNSTASLCNEQSKKIQLMSAEIASLKQEIQQLRSMIGIALSNSSRGGTS